jgi:uncharacterized RDD family membrane protein YckC
MEITDEELEGKIAHVCLRCSHAVLIPDDKSITGSCPECNEGFETVNGVLTHSYGLNYTTKLASFRQRLFARMIDGFLSSIIFGTIYFIVVSLFDSQTSTDIDNLESILGLSFFLLIYYPILDSLGGTVGKKIMGIKSVLKYNLDTPGKSDTYRRSYFLAYPFIVPMVIYKGGFDWLLNWLGSQLQGPLLVLAISICMINLFISPLAMLWSKTNQGFHDKYSDIIVIQNVKETEELLDKSKKEHYTFN